MCKGIEGYAENFADKKLRKQQDEIIKSMLMEEDISLEKIARWCKTTVEHVEKVREELEEEKVSVY